MDLSAGEIFFDENGCCNFCNEYIKSAKAKGLGAGNQEHHGVQLEKLTTDIKAQGKGKPYDCIVGVSGGVDSSWVLVNAVKLGLRPLAVHMDNGWNSNLAVSNISNLIEELGVDLYTHVINWEEYRLFMEAFFAADVIDIELLYDNALHEVCYSQARRYGLKHILSGSNFSTEGMRMPSTWAWESKWDGRNIVNIGKTLGVRRRTFPLFTTLKWLIYSFGFGIKWIPFLDMIDFRKEHALSVLESDFGYTRYPYKHYESVFTRFYQGYILPRKFGVDKRKVHLSSLIVSGQMNRDDALRDLKKIPYPSDKELQADLKFFLKKMGWGEEKLEEYLGRPGKSHTEYGTDLTRATVFPVLRLVARLLKRVGLLSRSNPN
jgi:N-acetyl sugar amidotransferase